MAAKWLKPGQKRVLASGEHRGVYWQHYEKQVLGTIGLTVGYALRYENHGAVYESTRMTGGQTPEQACEEFRAHVDGIPARRAAAEAAQRDAIGAYAREQLARDRERARLNPLTFTEATDAYKAAHGGRIPPAIYRRFASSGVTAAEHGSDWYQAALARKNGRP